MAPFSYQFNKQSKGIYQFKGLIIKDGISKGNDVALRNRIHNLSEKDVSGKNRYDAP